MTRRYYPLPTVVSNGGGGGPLSISNMHDGISDAEKDPIGSSTGDPGGTITTFFTANVSGGTPPYTYAWSAGNGQIGISDQTVVDPVFTATGSPPSSAKQSPFSLTVTDADSNTLTKWIYVQDYFNFTGP